ncbi:uncharacterized protein LOC131944291 [Physella acuta]|uniref:uncharacterized protein LOC131944291 n=1 Tax=Physella acuta TaxID=109671 RepID=UPI0027DBB554|nr:uncharacterized protein LOC131944291 [Physella acuta]
MQAPLQAHRVLALTAYTLVFFLLNCDASLTHRRVVNTRIDFQKDNSQQANHHKIFPYLQEGISDKSKGQYIVRQGVDIWSRLIKEIRFDASRDRGARTRWRRDLISSFCNTEQCKDALEAFLKWKAQNGYGDPSDRWG